MHLNHINLYKHLLGNTSAVMPSSSPGPAGVDGFRLAQGGLRTTQTIRNGLDTSPYLSGEAMPRRERMHR